MKTIVTAMGNPYINNRLKEMDDINVLEKDIIYIDGIFELIEDNIFIDILILNEKICEDKLMKVLERLDKLKITTFLIIEDISLYYKEDFEKFSFIKVFDNEEQIINKFSNKNVFRKNITREYKSNKRVITFLGGNGVGKTVISSIIAKSMSLSHKVILVDFDVINSNLSLLFNIKEPIKNNELKSLITKVDDGLYLLREIKFLFNENNKIDSYKVKSLLEQLKDEFEYVFIDTSSELVLKYIKTIIPNSDYNLFIVEGNLLELKKADQLLEVYHTDFDLDYKKTGIIINKDNLESIDKEIIQDIFSEMKIVGKINYNKIFNSYINSYTKEKIKIEDLLKIKKILEVA